MDNMNNKSVAQVLDMINAQIGEIENQVVNNPPPEEDNIPISNSIISIMNKCETIKNKILTIPTPSSNTLSTNGGSRKKNKKSKKSKTHKRKH
jgi:hypothetical protein